MPIENSSTRPTTSSPTNGLLPQLLRHGAAPLLRLSYDFAIIAAYAKKRNVSVWEVLGLTVDEKSATEAIFRLPDDVASLIAAVQTALDSQRTGDAASDDKKGEQSDPASFGSAVTELLADVAGPSAVTSVNEGARPAGTDAPVPEVTSPKAAEAATTPLSPMKTH